MPNEPLCRRARALTGHYLFTIMRRANSPSRLGHWTPLVCGREERQRRVGVGKGEKSVWLSRNSLGVQIQRHLIALAH